MKYRAYRYYCKMCGKTFLPCGYPPTHGRNTLIGWVVYENIVLRNSYRQISEELREVFRCDLGRTSLHDIKKTAAKYYEPTYQGLAEKIRSEKLVHVDETKISIGAETDYVWIFSTLNEVIYVYRKTREGDVLKEVLNGFKGILISDFYAAYDSVECLQQKCLIHLIRDINNDIFKHPFDEELKQLAHKFTLVLVPIIETIDRYGLKRYHLNKYRGRVDIFFKEVLRQNYTSDAAQNYQRRFKKYQHKLFCFLEHDGIPWNNNYAEHAIKCFALLRNLIGGTTTCEGISEYLVLLSIVETLKLRNLSVFRFLVSGALDIDEFSS